MKVLVTGGAGYIGSVAVERLIRPVLRVTGYVFIFVLLDIELFYTGLKPA